MYINFMLYFSSRDLPACIAHEFSEILHYPQWVLLATVSHTMHTFTIEMMKPQLSMMQF